MNGFVPERINMIMDSLFKELFQPKKYSFQENYQAQPVQTFGKLEILEI